MRCCKADRRNKDPHTKSKFMEVFRAPELLLNNFINVQSVVDDSCSEEKSNESEMNRN